jgi:hypothetical protein
VSRPGAGGEPPDPATFLSGQTGHVAGAGRIARRAADRALDARLRLAARRLDRLAAAAPRREVLVAGVYRPRGERIAAAVSELRRTRHGVRLALGSTGEALPALAAETVATGLGGGKFENLNAILAAAGETPDWLLVVDDDVTLPPRFLDRFLGVCEAAGFALAQPAQTLASHAAWPVTRRSPLALARRSRFVEIGPVTAFAARAARELLPFPPLRFGWGLDLHWSALAAERGWALGIVDATPVRHDLAPVAAGYPAGEAIDEARAFLATRPYLAAADAGAAEPWRPA